METTTQTTKQTQPNQEERQKSFKYSSDAVMAVRNVKNRKNTKRMDKALEDFNQEGCEQIKWFNPEKTQKITLSTEKLGQLHELAKGSKATAIDLTVETEKPVRAKLIDKHYREQGEVLIAPKISREIENQREQITEKSEINQAKDLLRKGLKKLDKKGEAGKETRGQLLENLIKAHTTHNAEIDPQQGGEK